MKIDLFKNFRIKKRIKNINIIRNIGISNICNRYGIKNFTINDDGSIDVEGNVHLEYKLNEGKFLIKFNRVNGAFHCYGNKLTTLENSPNYILKNFVCNRNKLTTLLGGPSHVNGDYFCHENYLKDMYGFPEDFRNYLDIGIANPVYEILLLSTLYPNLDLDILIKFIQWLNIYTVIRNGNTIVQDRLEEALSVVGKTLPENTNFRNYKLI